MTLLEAAKSYHDLGFVVLPLAASKIPLIKKWTSITVEEQSGNLEEILKDAEKIGIVIPNGYEVLDVDSKNSISPNLNKRFIQLLRMYDENLYNKLVMQATMNQGLHFFYATDNALPSRKLASRKPTEEEAKTNINRVVLIETRGIGGMVVVAPSDGYIMLNNSLKNIPKISKDEHELLINISKAFHERDRATISPQEAKNYLSGNNKPSWEDYIEQGNYEVSRSILEDAGWKTCGESDSNIYFTRPGKKHGISGDLHKDKNIFKAWTTNSNFDSDKWYDAFGILAVCNYGGDFSLCASDLLKKGFGEPFSDKKETEEELSELELVVKEIYAHQFDYHSSITLPDPILYIESGSHKTKGAYKGSLVGIVGKEKSMKTTVAKGIAAAALDPLQNHLNFTMTMTDKNVLWFETEQPQDRWFRGIKEIYSMVGATDNLRRFKSFSLKKYPAPMKKDAFLHIINNEKNVGLVILDGVVDLTVDYLDHVESSSLVYDLMTICDQGIMLVYLLHLTKAAGFMRGMLGTELANKSDLVIKAALKEEDESVADISCYRSRELKFKTYEITRDPVTGIPLLVDKVEKEVEQIPIPNINPKDLPW